VKNYSDPNFPIYSVFEMNSTDLTMLIVAIVVIGLFWLYVWLNRR
jgi:hypothetical protein